MFGGEGYWKNWISRKEILDNSILGGGIGLGSSGMGEFLPFMIEYGDQILSKNPEEENDENQ